MVKGVSRRSRALLDNAQVQSVDGSNVQLAAPGALARMISEESNTSVLATAMTDVVGGSWRITVVDGAGVTEPASSTASPRVVEPPTSSPAADAAAPPPVAPDPAAEPSPPASPETRSAPSAPGSRARSTTARARKPAAKAVATPEADPRDDPDFDPDLADSAPLDPEAEALRLLTDQLGARPLPNADA